MSSYGSGRDRKQTVPYGVFATKEEKKNSDPDGYDSGEDAPDFNDDLDWLPVDPTRPAPYSNTWSLVYAGLKKDASGPTGCLWSTGCQEGCGKLIFMNGQRQELAAQSTPHGKLRKPPVCHDVPWAHLRDALLEFEAGAKKQFTDEFRRYVCWGRMTNLRRGHNGCNSAGAKHTSATYGGAAKGAAIGLVQSCLKEAPVAGYSVWSA